MALTTKKIEKWSKKKKVSKLLGALSSHESDIRMAAIKALGQTKDETAMHSLITLLKDPDSAIRGATAEALGTMGNGRSIEFIRQLWNTESDETVREKAKVAIQAIKAVCTNEERH